MGYVFLPLECCVYILSIKLNGELFAVLGLQRHSKLQKVLCYDRSNFTSTNVPSGEIKRILIMFLFFKASTHLQRCL